MDVQFRTAVLARLEKDPSARPDLPPGIARKYAMRLTAIRAAPDVRDFYALKSLHFEKLKGNRSHQRSMRLNEQWRIVLELRESAQGTVVFVHDVEDYH